MAMQKKEDVMNSKGRINRRAAMGTGVLAGALLAGASFKDAHAQLLKTGISKNSVLAKVTRTGRLTVGYAQTMPNFYLDVKTNTLRGVFYDAVELLGKEIEVKIEYRQVTWADATIGLRKGDFDLFGSSLSYTAPRALVVAFVGPLYYKGFAAVANKANRAKFRTLSDLDNKDVTFAVNTGNASANIIKAEFPKAKIIEIPGPLAVEMEPVRSRQAQAAVEGDFDMQVFVEANDWAYIVDPEHPFGRRPNTWACRYGDPEWKFFLDTFCNWLTGSDWVKRRFAFYREELLKKG